MSSVCGGWKCLDCLLDGRFFVELINSTKCCVYNLATFDVDYVTAFAPGEDCPAADEPGVSGIVYGAVGVIGGIGMVAGLGLGAWAWAAFRRRQNRRRVSPSTPPNETLIEGGIDNDAITESSVREPEQNQALEIATGTVSTWPTRGPTARRDLVAFRTVSLDDARDDNDENEGWESLYRWASTIPSKMEKTRTVKKSETVEVFKLTTR